MARATGMARAFSPSDVSALHVRLIQSSLHALSDGRNGEETKGDIISWVMEEGMRPFSFDACCVFIDMHPERMRRTVLRLSRRLRQVQSSARIWDNIGTTGQ